MINSKSNENGAKLSKYKPNETKNYILCFSFNKYVFKNILNCFVLLKLWKKMFKIGIFYI